MNRTLHKFAPALSLLVLLSGTCLSAQNALHSLADTSRDWQMLMHSDAEIVITESDQSIRLIRSTDDWINFLEQMHSDPYHPLTGADKGVLRKFSEKLLFGKFGIAGAYIGGIEREISHYNYVRLWEFFGMTEKLAADYKGYKCRRTGTVWAISTYISTSNCHTADSAGLFSVPSQ